jgi:sortase A
VDNGTVPPLPRRFRRAAAAGLAAVLVAGGAVAAGTWAGASGGGPTAMAPAPTTTVPPPSTTGPAATAAPSLRVTRVGDSPVSGLPQPEPLPTDPRAPEPLAPLGTIEIPAIDLVHVVYEGITLTTIDRGPGHWPGTAMPGQIGNAVFAGHRTTHTHPFFRLNELDPGDEVVFTDVDGHRFEYEHVSTEVVTPDTLSIATQTQEATATLFACHPPGSAASRIVAHLRLVGGSGLPASFPARDR